MNKTVTINLAGINFYVDEEAYKKLDHYLKAISASLHEESRAETMQDIEARIAELFLEKLKSENEVLGLPAIESVIAIMGQPEDFQVDDGVFEEEEPKAQKSKRSKKLYRDVDHSAIGGVCAGLSHYFDISIFWVRVLFLVLLIPSATTVILAYIILWILTPAAHTTSEKLDMQGEKININNIERQVREGFSNFKNNVENADYSWLKRFFNALKTAIFAVGLFIAKAIGVILVFIGGCGLLALLFSFLSAGTFSIFEAPWIDYVTAADIGLPFWAAAALVFLFVGIPLFFLLLLGLKILVNKLKSIGNPAKAVLFGLWLLALFTLSGLGIRQATVRAFESKTTQVKRLNLSESNSLNVELYNPKNNLDSYAPIDDFTIKTDSTGQKFILSNEVDLNIRPSSKHARLEIHKSASGNGHQDAKATASNIQYSIDFKNDTLFLADYFTTAIENKFKHQNVDLVLYLPENVLFSISGKMRYLTDNIPSSYNGHSLKFTDAALECLDCQDHNSPNSTKETNANDINSDRNKENRKQKNPESEWYQKEPPVNSQDPKKDTLKTTKPK